MPGVLKLLYALIASEEEFYTRVSFLREQALALGNGLVWAVSVTEPASES